MTTRHEWAASGWRPVQKRESSPSNSAGCMKTSFTPKLRLLACSVEDERTAGCMQKLAKLMH